MNMKFLVVVAPPRLFIKYLINTSNAKKSQLKNHGCDRNRGRCGGNQTKESKLTQGNPPKVLGTGRMQPIDGDYLFYITTKYW